MLVRVMEREASGVGWVLSGGGLFGIGWGFLVGVFARRASGR